MQKLKWISFQSNGHDGGNHPNCRCHYTLTKIMRKIRIFFSKFTQNENIFVKIGELFAAHFDKNILILRKIGEKILSFSHDFLMIIVSVVAGVTY